MPFNGAEFFDKYDEQGKLDELCKGTVWFQGQIETGVNDWIRKEVMKMKDVYYLIIPRLEGKIKEVFGTQSAFAEAMTMSPVSLSEKLNNKVQVQSEGN